MVELLCTLGGIVAGIAIVASLMSQNENGLQANPEGDISPEKMNGIANQLQILTNRVARDVTEHTLKVENINERLTPLQDDAEPAEIMSAIAELINVNQSMQGQLADAKKRLSMQSMEIEATARQARTDALTGLANRRALDEFLADCIENVKETDVVGLLLIDIDHFKSLNDNYGHTTGDAVLAKYGRYISQFSDGKEYVARYGGEEFAVIMTGRDVQSLVQRAATLCKSISEQVFEHEDLKFRITSSAGFSLFTSEDTPKQIYDRADEGLYRSKKAGRNRGHWLNQSKWCEFPTIANAEKKVLQTNSPTEASASLEATTLLDRSDVAVSAEVKPTEIEAAKPASENSSVKDRNDKPPRELMELNGFVERLNTQLTLLRRAELPATAIMIECIGLQNYSYDEVAASWRMFLKLVDGQLRGLDFVGFFRPGILCVFMPGLSVDAAIERVTLMQQALEDQRSSWGDYCPERLAMAVASAETNEEAGSFLNRLEIALEEAQDASTFEVVVNVSGSCYFQAT